jgi:hypothetical protein
MPVNVGSAHVSTTGVHVRTGGVENEPSSHARVKLFAPAVWTVPSAQLQQ